MEGVISITTVYNTGSNRTSQRVISINRAVDGSTPVAGDSELVLSIPVYPHPLYSERVALEIFQEI